VRAGRSSGTSPAGLGTFELLFDWVRIISIWHGQARYAVEKENANARAQQTKSVNQGRSERDRLSVP
jgi:hypothetical protein